MNKRFIIAQWFALAALAVFVTYVIVRPTPRPDYAPETWRNWSGVTVLSYAGIARKDAPAYPSVKRLEAQLTALRDAGYRTVRPEDVRAFLEERAPLPDKALLLLFEGGRKEAFIRATPILQRTGFTAVIAVPTVVMGQWGGFYLKRGDLRKIARLPQWEIGSMGHQAIEPAPGAPASTSEESHFLAQRAKADGREESADAFRERVLQDYARSESLLEDATGKPPLIYLYPFAEAGQSPNADPLAEAANRDAVTRHFALAFIGGSNAFNGPGSDPWSLTRLRVPGVWTPERLLQELAASQPRNRPQTTLGTSLDWVFEREGALRDSELSLSAGAVAWLRGTDGWTDCDVSADLHPEENGAGSLYARYTGVRSWLRVTADAEGVRLQERLGNRLTTLYRQPADTVASTRIRLRLRNNRAWLWRDGQPLAENLPVSTATRRGRIGLGSERSALHVNAFDARPLPSRWILGNSIRLIAEDKRDPVQAILPNWFRAGEAPDIAETAKQDLLQAAVTGIRTIPLLSGGTELSASAARAWADAIDEGLVRFQLNALTPILAVEGPAFDLSSELRNRHYRITHLLTPAQAHDWGRIIAQTAPDEVIIVNGLGAEADAVVNDLLRVIPASRLAVREPDDTAFTPPLATVRLYDPPTDR